MAHVHARLPKSRLLIGGLLLGMVPALSGQDRPPDPDFSAVRAQLERYQDPIVAIHDGYFSTVACIEFPGQAAAGRMQYAAGGMGVHFLNVGLIGPDLDIAKPQVLLYEPDGDKLRLVGAEWFVPTAVMKEQPRLFGRGFDGPMEGHHPLMPAEMHHWDLHVWLWKDNPAGVFSPTNPALKCPAQGYRLQEEAPKIVQP